MKHLCTKAIISQTHNGKGTGLNDRNCMQQRCYRCRCHRGCRQPSMERKNRCFDTKSEKAKDIDQQRNIHMIANGRKIQIAAKNKSNIIAE